MNLDNMFINLFREESASTYHRGMWILLNLGNNYREIYLTIVTKKGTLVYRDKWYTMNRHLTVEDTEKIKGEISDLIHEFVG